jgi:hypothetical protein
MSSTSSSSTGLAESKVAATQPRQVLHAVRRAARLEESKDSKEEKKSVPSTMSEALKSFASPTPAPKPVPVEAPSPTSTNWYQRTLFYKKDTDSEEIWKMFSKEMKTRGFSQFALKDPTPNVDSEGKKSFETKNVIMLPDKAEYKKEWETEYKGQDIDVILMTAREDFDFGPWERETIEEVYDGGFEIPAYVRYGLLKELLYMQLLQAIDDIKAKRPVFLTLAFVQQGIPDWKWKYFTELGALLGLKPCTSQVDKIPLLLPSPDSVDVDFKDLPDKARTPDLLARVAFRFHDRWSRTRTGTYNRHQVMDRLTTIDMLKHNRSCDVEMNRWAEIAFRFSQAQCFVLLEDQKTVPERAAMLARIGHLCVSSLQFGSVQECAKCYLAQTRELVSDAMASDKQYDPRLNFFKVSDLLTSVRHNLPVPDS